MEFFCMVRVSRRKLADFTPVDDSGKRRHLTANRQFYALLFDHAAWNSGSCLRASGVMGHFGGHIPVPKIGTLGLPRGFRLALGDSKNPEDFLMKSKSLWRGIQMITVILLAVAPQMLAQDPPPVVHLSGLISDYTPVSGVSGPWEMRGEWSLSLQGDSGKATFSASMNMTHSDYWVVLNPGAADDNSAATGRHPHTHFITVSNAKITTLAGGGFQLSGPVVVTADGDAAPFMSKCSDLTPCQLTVDVVGGKVLPLSNITLTFSGPPTSHFGTQAIHGFIRMGN